jgi:mercuric ion binding protein
MASKKDVVIGLTAIAAMVLLPGAARSQVQERGTDEIVATDSLLKGVTVQLKVDGMVCPFCAYGLEKRLRNLPAVDAVTVRISDGLVQIREKDGQRLTHEGLRREVERAGFTLREMKRVDS